MKNKKMKQFMGRLAITACCIGMLTGCGKKDADNEKEANEKNEVITTEQTSETEEVIVGAPDDYGWLTQASYEELEMPMADGTIQKVYSTFLDDRMRLAYDNPSYIFFADIIFPAPVRDIQTVYGTEHFCDLNEDGYGDYMVTDLVDETYITYCFIYDPNEIVFNYSQKYSDAINAEGLYVGEEIPENLKYLAGRWYLDGKLSNDYLLFYSDYTMMECTSEGVGKYKGIVSITDRENPDGTSGTWVEVYDEAGVMLYSFGYPENQDVIDIYTDDAGKQFVRQELSE